MFKRLDTVCLTVSNIEKSKTWYQNLGFQISYDGGHYVIFNIGDSSIPLTIEKGDTALHSHSVYPILFSNNIEEVREQLISKGITVTELTKDGLNTFFNFFDLDNNRLQVCYWEE